MKMFNKFTKRAISLVLCLLMLVPFCVTAFAAVPVTPELQAAMGRFRDGSGPATQGYVTEYKYSSPIEGQAGNTTKYPVVFFVGNTRNNSYVGAELRETSFPLWASDEYQARFYETKGAYIVFSRPAPVEEIFGIYYNEVAVRASLKAMMDDFISKNQANVDTNRIYLVSWDEGCRLAVKLAVANPDYFSALVMMSPTYAPTSDEFTTLANIPMWLFACKQDTVADYNACGETVWNAIKTTNAFVYDSRFTSFDSFNTTGYKHHTTWEYAAYDMHYNGEYSGMNTINAKGQSVSFDGEEGMISWLSKIGSSYGSDCTCDCHNATGFAQLLWMLKMLISMMFKIERNRMCECGIAHF